MTKKMQVLLFLSGLWIFFAWGFRLYILIVRWGSDLFVVRSAFFAFIFILIGGFLVRLGILGAMAKKRNYIQLVYASLFIIGYWAYRLANLVIYPDIDPNPRAHLHLSVAFIVIGALLLAGGIRGQRKKTI